MNIYAVSQIVIGILLAPSILVQQRASGLSSTFGGSGAAQIVQRRGAEKLIYQLSIVLSIVFFGLSLVRRFTF